jgi:flagellar FliL protein
MSTPADPPAADAAPPASKAGKSVPLALLLSVAVGLAAGGGAGVCGAGPLLAAGIAPAVTATAKSAGSHAPAGDDGEGEDAGAADGDAGGDASGESGGEHGKDGGAAAASVYTLDNLVLNPAESGGTRFLLLSITFQVKDAATAEAMKLRDAELRDAVLVTVGNRTVDQLASVGVRDSLKHELQAAAKKLFRKNVVKRVYFPQFVIQ